MSIHRQRANNALGICVIATMFLAETVVADHVRPHPGSPLLWALLGTAAAGSLGAWRWHLRRDRESDAGPRP